MKIINIYEQPLTEKNFIGKGRVIKVHFKNSDTAYCKIKFINKPDDFCSDWGNYWVKLEDIIKW